MYKTQWNSVYYTPPAAPYDNSKGAAKAAIQAHILENGPSTVELLARHLKRTVPSTRHIMREMREGGLIYSKRLNIAGNVTYWALIAADLDTLQEKH
jgi:predicted transcriptional regulator